MSDPITVQEIAQAHKVGEKQLRARLRSMNLGWHPVRYMRWIAERGSAEEADMIRAARSLAQ